MLAKLPIVPFHGKHEKDVAQIREESQQALHCVSPVVAMNLQANFTAGIAALQLATAAAS